jgi:hypothetical protein
MYLGDWKCRDKYIPKENCYIICFFFSLDLFLLTYLQVDVVSIG